MRVNALQVERRLIRLHNHYVYIYIEREIRVEKKQKEYSKNQ